MTQGDNSWIPDTPTTGDIQVSKRPLYFLIASALVLVAAVMIVFYVMVIKAGSDLASDPTTNAATSEVTTTAPEDVTTSPDDDPSPSTSAAGTDFEQAAAALETVRTSSTCKPGNGDTAAIVNYVTTAEATSNWDDVAKAKVMDTLKAIDDSCPKSFVVLIQQDLSSTTVPKSLNDLVADLSWITPERAAPAGAIEASTFTTPARNIRCTIDDDSVDCSIYTYNYPSPTGCEGQTATYSTTALGETSAGCSTAVNAAQTYEYGTTIAKNGFACTLEETGMTCWSTISGHGFELKRSADRIF